MTEPERKVARQRLNAARRQALAGEDVCAHCSTAFVRTNARQMYCGKPCGRAAWMRTPAGRSFNRERKRRQRATKREQALAVAA